MQGSSTSGSKWSGTLTDVFNRFLEELLQHPIEGNKPSPKYNGGPDGDRAAPTERLQENQHVQCLVLDFTMKSEHGFGGKGRLYVDYIIRVQFNPAKYEPLEEPIGDTEIEVQPIIDPLSPRTASPTEQERRPVRDHIFISRRFQQFHYLHDKLRRTFRGSLPILPARTFIGDSLMAEVIETRKMQLQAYLDVLTSHPEWWCTPLAEFCGVRPINNVSPSIEVPHEPSPQQPSVLEPSSSPSAGSDSVAPTKITISGQLQGEGLDEDIIDDVDLTSPPVRRLDEDELEEQERIQDEMFEL